MYEELVTALRKRAVELPEKFSKNAENIDLFLKAANAIEDLEGKHFMIKKTAEWLAERVPKWISVTERLPDTFKHVLVNIPGMTPHPTVQEAFLEKNGMWYSNGFRYSAEEITHWMPLPEPPKEK